MSKKEINFNLPIYCDFFRFFLVEELALWSNPITLHYGKCSVIGRLVNDNNGCLFLENCKILSLSQEYQLDDGMVRLPLSNSICKNRQIPINVYVELCGEVILLNKNKCKQNENQLPTTSSILMNQVRELQLKMEADRGLPAKEPTGFGDRGMNSTIRMTLKGFVNEFKETYEPAIQLYNFLVIDQPHELIVCNLELRSHRKKLTNRDEIRINRN